MVDRQRIIDVLVAAPALAVSSLPILFAAAAAKMTNRRETAFFKQKRYGLHGKPFTIYKIRTMISQRGADGLLLPDAARVTRVGAFLRRTALDELPQFWNILKGDMSLIGPRPLFFKPDLPEFSDRYVVRPSLTGLAQVMQNARPEISVNQYTEAALRERLAFDLRYIKTAGVRTNMKILWRTAAIVLTGRNDSLRAPARAAPQVARPRPLSMPKVKHDSGVRV